MQTQVFADKQTDPLTLPIEQVEGSFFAFFSNNKGIVIPQNSDTLVLFERFEKTWDTALFKRLEVASITATAVNADQIVPLTNVGIGPAVGIALKNSMDSARAHAKAGIRIKMKAIDLPDWFMHIPDTQERSIAHQALTQFQLGEMHGSFVHIPREVHAVLTAQQFRERDHVNIEKRQSAWIPAAAVFALIAGGFLLAIHPF
ncbi:hypothetical protein [uncultured Roseibium sp.]|uniref:hypothetical protein n=1 Tax=uncultured Roseibium sp. TaxID=1936171 RepID=UPI00261509CD|nr:hypothetical protein [uncultured Roseibium sp.]